MWTILLATCPNTCRSRQKGCKFTFAISFTFAFRKALQMAFDLWSRIVPLEFSESSDGQADIRIRFAREDHGDPWPFKGRGVFFGKGLLNLS
jgi:hypothetical protein